MPDTPSPSFLPLPLREGGGLRSFHFLLIQKRGRIKVGEGID